MSECFFLYFYQILVKSIMLYTSCMTKHRKAQSIPPPAFSQVIPVHCAILRISAFQRRQRSATTMTSFCVPIRRRGERGCVLLPWFQTDFMSSALQMDIDCVFISWVLNSVNCCCCQDWVDNWCTTCIAFRSTMLWKKLYLRLDVFSVGCYVFTVWKLHSLKAAENACM